MFYRGGARTAIARTPHCSLIGSGSWATRSSVTEVAVDRLADAPRPDGTRRCYLLLLVSPTTRVVGHR